MGSKAISKSHRKCVKKVLRGLNFEIGFPEVGTDDRRTPTFVTKSVTERRPCSGPYQEKSGRTLTSHRLQDAHLLRRFDPDTMDALTKAYLQEHPNGSTKFVYAKACKIERYVRFCQESGYTAVQGLESVDLAQQFCFTLKGAVQPFSARNHADAVVDFLQLISVLPSLKAAFQHRRRRRINTVLEEWRKIRRSLDKDSRRMQALKVRTLGFKPAPLLDICIYLANYREDGLDSDFCLVEGQIESGLRFLSEHTKAYKRIVCYLSVFMALHGQRKGAANQMTVAEVVNALTYEGTKIVAISRHKTDYVVGPAYVALKPHQYSALTRMAKLRINLGGDSESAVIAGISGREPGEPFGPIIASLSEPTKEPLELTFNKIRKTAESTKGLSRDAGPSAGSDRVSSYLCHGTGAAALHYQFKTPQEIIAESRALDQVHAQVILQEMARRGQIPLPAAHYGKSQG